jgi:hypothetical protein
VTPVNPKAYGWVHVEGRTWRRPDGSLFVFPGKEPMVIYVKRAA